MKYILCAALMMVLWLPGVGYAQEKAAKIEVYKDDRKLYLLNKAGERIREYNISLGGNPNGKKTQEGDMKTPEGLYTINHKNPNSRFHLGLKVSYPNAEDIKQAKARGVSTGGDIMVHGLPNERTWPEWMDGLYTYFNDEWTAGCIAVTNEAIREIWGMVDTGTPIEIFP